MTQYDKLLFKILRGLSDANIAFNDLRRLLLRMGFLERIDGSHYIFTKEGIDGLVNLQDHEGKVIPYQVKQVRKLIKKYRLEGDL